MHLTQWLGIPILSEWVCLENANLHSAKNALLSILSWYCETCEIRTCSNEGKDSANAPCRPGRSGSDQRSRFDGAAAAHKHRLLVPPDEEDFLARQAASISLASTIIMLLIVIHAKPLFSGRKYFDHVPDLRTPPLPLSSSRRGASEAKISGTTDDGGAIGSMFHSIMISPRSAARPKEGGHGILPLPPRFDTINSIFPVSIAADAKSVGGDDGRGVLR